jgi:hypothetical protein
VDQARVIADVLQRHRERRDAGLRDWTVSDLRRTAKRVAARLCLNLAEQRRECHRKRGVRLHLRGQGSATISADLADDDATRIFNRLTAMAYGLDAETDGDNDGDGRRSLDQRRADLFTDLLLGPPLGQPVTHPTPQLPATVAGSEVAVVIDLPTLLRMADNPADMPGCGPVAAEIARQLAADAKWRAWLTDTVGGQVIATSPSTYRPTAAVARLVRAREPYCRMPGCRVEITDLDHVIPFPKGEQHRQNLGPICRRHHRMKTHSRWRIRTNDDDPDGSWTWTTPTGITHTDHPEPPLGDEGDHRGNDQGGQIGDRRTGSRHQQQIEHAEVDNHGRTTDESHPDPLAGHPTPGARVSPVGQSLGHIGSFRNSGRGTDRRPAMTAPIAAGEYTV